MIARSPSRTVRRKSPPDAMLLWRKRIQVVRYTCRSKKFYETQLFVGSKHYCERCGIRISAKAFPRERDGKETTFLWKYCKACFRARRLEEQEALQTAMSGYGKRKPKKQEPHVKARRNAKTYYV